MCCFLDCVTAWWTYHIPKQPPTTTRNESQGIDDEWLHTEYWKYAYAFTIQVKITWFIDWLIDDWRMS